MTLLYGDEFWSTLDRLVPAATRRVMFMTAYLKPETHTKYAALVPSGVQRITVCRHDAAKVLPSDAVVVSGSYFHGKLYLIDNTLIIGSQNLYDAGKEGEFSVMMEMDEWNSSLAVYQALLKIAEDSILAKPEPVASDFLDLYQDGCPFCGGMAAEPLSVVECPEYGGGFVSEEDCASYGGDGACKFCIPENRRPLGECFCCDDSGCGFGIRAKTMTLIHHSINPTTGNKGRNALLFLRLFNFFHSTMGARTVDMIRLLGLPGKVYVANPNRTSMLFTQVYK